jgi:hypothetical protein
MADKGTIEVLITSNPAPGSKGLWEARALSSMQANVDALRESLADEVEKLTTIMSALDKQSSKFRCDEVEISLEVTAEGGFRLIGSASAAATATFSLKFRRRAGE